MAKIFKRLLCTVLAVVMCFGTILPVAATETGAAEIPNPPTEVGNNYPLDKVLNTFQNDIANITLSVPADEVALGVDIIYIVGSYATNEDGTPNPKGDVLISSLMDAIAEIVEAGIPVNFGMVPFSSDNVVAMPLTKFDASNIDTLDEKIAEALATCEALYDGVNMENALVKSKKMFSESDLGKAGHTERQHLVMITSGMTYFFNSGENNENAATVPVNYTGVNRLFYWNKAWQRARTNQTNTYPIPKGIVEAYNKTDKTNTLWEFYWSYIDQWAKADIVAGDKVVYDACTIESGNFLKWYNSGELVSGYSQTGYGKAVPEKEMTEKGINVADFVTLTAGANPLTNVAAAHAIGYERAMWEAYEYAKANFMDAGINFYPIYNALNVNYTNGNASPASYGVTWTDQYIGHSFVDMLAGGEGKAVKYDKQGDKAFFDPIKEAILYTVSDGSKVTDAIGYDAEKGNFEFITDAGTIKLAVNGKAYTTVMTGSKTDATGKIIEASYDFLNKEGERKFSLNYYYGDGKEGEYFDWNFHTDVSMKDRVALTYDLKLIDKSGEAGKHTLDTNRFAALYPVDSDGNDRDPQLFPVPSVEYEVVPYDVDIVLALGAGIAQYDSDAKYNYTYTSIVDLVEPLVLQGINVKLGLVAVEHYDDVALPLTVLTKENYKAVITEGLETIQSMPAGPTNLHGNLEAAKAMLDADTSVPAENKFFYVFATGRTYNYDNADGVPTTIINKVALKGSTYYYWGHYLWQSQRGGHTSLYMIPARYNNDFSAYWEDVCKWVEADGDKYAYSFTDAYDVTDPQWFNNFYSANTTDAKAMKLASSRYGWILKDLTNTVLAGIGSGSNPQNALNYERAQYEAYQTYVKMANTYNCFALCTESPAYQNESLYITLGAGYKGTSNIQLGHSFMNFLAQADGQENAPVLFEYVFDANNNPIGTDFTTDNYFEGMGIDTTKLVKTEKEEKGPMMMAPAPKKSIVITSQPTDVEVEVGTKFAITVEAEGEGLTYQWYYKNKGGKEFAPSSFKSKSYAMTMAEYCHERQVYCVITDANGNTVTTDTATITRPALSLAITAQPQSVVAEIGEKVTVTVGAQGEGLTYQWYYKNKGGAEFTTSSYKSKTYSITMAEYCHMRELYCVVTDANGNTVTTETVTIARPAKTLTLLSQPTDVTAKSGTTAKVTVNADGDGLTYQWFYKNKNGKSFAVSSIKSKTYAVSMASYCDMREVYCVVTDAYGNTVTTDTVKLILEK